MTAYYNEIDPAAATILRHMIDEGVIAPGDVDTRSIKEVTPNDVAGYTQAHFFAGGGLWSVAARLAGWPDSAPLWTGSCPCQPFSAAGKGGGTDDPRHLWPDFHRLISAVRPAVVMGEQVAGKAGYGWFDGVRADLAGEGYAGRAVDFPACSVDAPHQRNRLYWIAMEHTASLGRGEGWPPAEFRGGWPTPAGANARGTLDHGVGPGLEGYARDGDRSRRQEPDRPAAPANGAECILSPDPAVSLVQGQPSAWHEQNHRADAGIHADANGSGPHASAQAGVHRQAQGQWAWNVEPQRSSRSDRRNGTYWSDAEWISCHDDKARRAKSGIRFLVDGLPGRVDLWRVGGNAIVPEAAAEVIAAFMDAYGVPALDSRRVA